MRASVGTINMLVGATYLALSFLIVLDLRRGWHLFGFARFGGGLAAVALTCGAHHVVHGQHVLFEGHYPGALDLVSVIVGVPFGLTWLALRVEALAGGAGDRVIAGTPWWLLALPTAAAVYVTAMLAGAVGAVGGVPTLDVALIPHVALVGVYVAIGWMLVRTQLLFHRQCFGWSLSGCSAAGIFLTCAVMHAAIVVYGLAGRRVVDVHEFVITLVSVPAGLYFLSVVRGLVRDQVSDWNVVPDETIGAGPRA